MGSQSATQCSKASHAKQVMQSKSCKANLFYPVADTWTMQSSGIIRTHEESPTEQLRLQWCTIGGEVYMWEGHKNMSSDTCQPSSRLRFEQLIEEKQNQKHQQQELY